MGGKGRGVGLANTCERELSETRMGKRKAGHAVPPLGMRGEADGEGGKVPSDHIEACEGAFLSEFICLFASECYKVTNGTHTRKGTLTH